MLSISPSLPAHCDPQGHLLAWLSSTFHTCVPTPLALTTTVLGSVSFLAWLFAQLPQIYKNYKLKSTAGLSLYFLIEWLLGDTTNLAGAILTKQASWQILIASYYTFVDCVMVLQYLYYTHHKPRRMALLHAQRWDPTHQHGRASRGADPQPEGSEPGVQEQAESKPKGLPSSASAFAFLRPSSSPREKGSPGSRPIVRRHGNSSSPAPSPKTILFLSMLLAVASRASPISPELDGALHLSPESRSEIAGRFISWASTLLYLASRLPQIFKNARRRSTSGLSLSLFVAAFFGNFFYSASLLTNPLGWGSYPAYGHHGWAGPEGNDRRQWLLLALPFWLGAAGVLALDLTIGIQFVVYGDGADNRSSVVVVQVEDSRGRADWRRVSGWMRGWVPSPGPKGRTAVVEDQRPLLERHGGSRSYGI